jgi:D-alanine-D-alanine ligase-like ATP-grasp enzyme
MTKEEQLEKAILEVIRIVRKDHNFTLKEASYLKNVITETIKDIESD